MTSANLRLPGKSKRGSAVGSGDWLGQVIRIPYLSITFVLTLALLTLPGLTDVELSTTMLTVGLVTVCKLPGVIPPATMLTVALVTVSTLVTGVVFVIVADVDASFWPHPTNRTQRESPTIMLQTNI
jgi:hypothetical protein